MKLLVLLAPAAMLAMLWALERLEVWMSRAAGDARHPHRRVPARSTRPPGRHQGDGRG